MTDAPQEPATTGRSGRRPGASAIGRYVESIGYGLLGAGVVLLSLAYLGAYLRGGLTALGDALYPMAAQNYLTLLPIAPGCFVLWVGRKMAGK